jgi:phenylpropionate dioxygenase-like ring-hydroxylating dioxygenase large terminal subunit
VTRAYDLYWVCVGTEPRNLPAYPAYDLHPGQSTMCAPKRVHTSGPRIVENFLDMAHFPFVHAGYLGKVPHTEVRDHDVGIHDLDPAGTAGIGTVDGELRATNCLFWQPQPGPGASPGGDVTYTYGVSHPYAARLVKIPSEADGGERAGFEILLAVSPESELTCRAWMLTTAYDPAADLERFNEFGALIFGQDVAVIESQRPARLPLDPLAEHHQRADRMSLAYRRWLVDRGIRYGTSRNARHTS